MDKLRNILFSLLTIGSLTTAQGQVFVNYDSAIVLEAGQHWYDSPDLAKVVVDLEEFPLTELSINLPGNSALFVDEVMWLQTTADSSFTIPLQSLKEQFPSEENARALAVYKKGIRLDEISVKKGRFDKGDIASTVEAHDATFSVRLVSPMEQFFFLAILTVFVLISFFKLMFPEVLSLIITPGLVFSSEDFSESNSGTKFFTEEVLFFLVIFNMLLMLVIMLGGYYLKMPIIEKLIRGDLNYLFFIWLCGTGILSAISILKYFWLKVCSFVFGLGKIEFVHFFYVMRVVSVILIAIYFALIICFTNDVLPIAVLMNYLLVGFFTIYIFGLLLLFFIMSKNVSLKNYHLFSYLCTAELVPFLVISKLIIG